MSIIVPGAIEITGPHDVGKTSMALECGAPPSKIAFFDIDVKGRATISPIMSSFGIYCDLLELWKNCKREYERLPLFQTFLADIDPGVYDTMIFDTWTPIGRACREYVVKYPQEFRDKYTGTSAMINGQYSTVGRQIEERIITDCLMKVQQVILVCHLADDWSRGVRTGKQIPDNSSTLDRVCNMRIWLRHNPLGIGVPVGLVLKRLSTKIVVDDQIRTVNILPRKLVPRPGEESLWDTIRRYVFEPVGNRALELYEQPDQFELSILDGTLTEEEKLTMEIYKMQQASIEVFPEKELIFDDEEDNPLKAKAKQMQSEGSSLVEIAAALEMKVPDVAKLLK